MRLAERVLALAALGAALLFAAACGGDDTGGALSPTPATTATSELSPTAAAPTAAIATPTPTVAATPEPAFEGTYGPVDTKAAASAPVALRDVRVGSGPQFDTIVFQFDGTAVPGYSVQYADRAPACPSPPSGSSGQPAATVTRGRGTPSPTPTDTPTPTPFSDIKANALIAVKLNPVDATGSRRTDFRGGQKQIVQASQVCTGEGVVAWVIGVNAKQPFRVTTLDNPARIVIDIQQ